MSRKLRVWVDPKICVGNTMCEAIAPSTFHLNEQRQSEANDPAGDSEEPSQRDHGRGRGDGRTSVSLVRAASFVAPSGADVAPGAVDSLWCAFRCQRFRGAFRCPHGIRRGQAPRRNRIAGVPAFLSCVPGRRVAPSRGRRIWARLLHPARAPGGRDQARRLAAIRSAVAMTRSARKTIG